MVAIGLGLFVFVSRLISKPVNEMVEVARKMAVGDMGMSINVSGKDEIGQLAESMQVLFKCTGEIAQLAERSQVSAQEIKGVASSSVQTAANAGKLIDEIVPQIQKTAERRKAEGIRVALQEGADGEFQRY